MNLVAAVCSKQAERMTFRLTLVPIARWVYRVNATTQANARFHVPCACLPRFVACHFDPTVNLGLASTGVELIFFCLGREIDQP
jgi:hypothetical protein